MITLNFPTDNKKYNTKGKHSIYVVDSNFTSNSITIEMVEKRDVHQIAISKEQALKIAQDFVMTKKINLSKYEYSSTEDANAQNSWVIIYSPLEHIRGGRIIVLVNKITGKVFISPDE